MSTPVCAGTDAEVRKAAECSHEFVETTRKTEHGRLSVLERCVRCVAVRCRMKEVGDGEAL